MQMQIIIVIFLMVNKISEKCPKPNILRYLPRRDQGMSDGILVLQIHMTNWDNHKTRKEKLNS